ncbi:hypothetical protein MHH81_08620 [Psychrobacillus sp. FSL H8-0484]|uniref:hypothetical protein n=1 Tax=Psychrobacillus sp. FSL H8-0484 TaxID=2921390 RepID=UPI0030F9C5F9
MAHLKLKKVMPLITLLYFAFLLCACGNSITNAESKSIEDYPVGVQDGTVSAEFYDRLKNYSTSDNQYQDEIGEMLNSIDENPKLIYSSEFVQKFSEDISKYNDFLIESNFIGTTDAEKEFSLILADITENQLAINTSLEKYITSKNILHFIPMAVRFNSVETKSEEFVKALKNYNIYE